MGQGRRWLLLYLILCCTCDVCGIGSLALIRPFAPTDAAKLPSSFDPWDLHLPCLANLSVVVDLILCFSQDLATDPEAANATQRIIADFHSRKAEAEAAAEDADLVGVVWTWPQCFRSISAVSALTPLEDDTYLPEGSGEAPDWVKGPNLQFLAMAEAFDDNDWGDYDVWFMMEMDCKTRRAGWLAELLEEVDARAPFAVLGSFYRGDQWDKFPMPLELRHHINGNAVYNRSNPFLQRYVATLRRAMDEGPVLQAFDVFGAALYLNSTLPPDQLGWYAGDSRVIGNYAHTPMLEVYFNGEALVHGGRLYDEWNATEQPITLVVSDFGRWDPTQPAKTELETFTESVLEGHHPFRHVIALRPQPNVTADPRTYPLANDTLLFREVARNESGWFDWCDAPVTTPWLMYTNVFFRLPARIDLPKARTNGSVPVAFYLPSGSPHCQNAPACVFQMRRAKNFTGSEPTGHLDIGQVLIHTAQRDAFCAAWRAWHATAPGAALGPVPGPTADDYAAYLLSRGLNGLYLWENALKRGQRSYFLLRVFPTDNLGNVSSNSSGNASTNATGNASACTLLTEESACLATPRCAWRPRFEDCFHGTLAAVPQPPALNVTFADPLGCPADIAVPALRVHNGGPRSLTLETPAAPGWWLSLTPAETGAVPPVDVSAANVTAGQAVVAQEVVVVNTAPQVLLTFLLPLLPLGTLTAAANPPQAYFKDLVSLVPGSGAVELLELDAAAAPLVLSPVEQVDGWLRSAVNATPNWLVLNTAVAPANATRLLLALRLTGHVAAFPVHRCTTLAIPLAPDFSALPSPASVSPGAASPSAPAASPRTPHSPSPSPSPEDQNGNPGGNGTVLIGSVSPSPRPSHSPKRSPRPSHSPERSPRPSHSPHRSPRPSHSPHRSPRPSHSPQRSSRPSHSPQRSPQPSHSPQRSPHPSHSPSRSARPSHSPAISPRASPSRSPVASASPSPRASPSRSPVASASPSPAASPSPSPSPLPGLIVRNTSITATDEERIRRFVQVVVGTLTQVLAMSQAARAQMAQAITQTTTYRYLDADQSYVVVENGTTFPLTRPGQPFSVVATHWGPNVTRAVVTVWALAAASFVTLNITPPAAVDLQDQLMLVVIDRMDDEGNPLNSAPMQLDVLTNATLRLGGLYYAPGDPTGLSLRSEGSTLEHLHAQYRIMLPHTSAVNVFKVAGNNPAAFDAFDNSTASAESPSKSGSDLALLGLLALPLGAVAAAAALWVWARNRRQPEERCLQFTRAVEDNDRRHYNTPIPVVGEPMADDDDDEFFSGDDEDDLRGTPYATPVTLPRKFRFGSVASLDLDGFSDAEVCAVVALATPISDRTSDAGLWTIDPERRDSRISIDDLLEPSSASVTSSRRPSTEPLSGVRRVSRISIDDLVEPSSASVTSSRRPSTEPLSGARRDSRIAIDPALCIPDHGLFLPRPGLTSPMSSSRRGSSPRSVSSAPEHPAPKPSPRRPLLLRLRPQPRSSLPTLQLEGEPASAVTAGFAAPTSSPLPEPAE